ncbi:hypothetical protein MUK42_15172 [Musa troglodytarum]|uniref:Uncharacterized protein n=1 Tax=Musa troglodytarum TaxID=320322 RepID=A0A9E7JFV6_9LILI|nr:hypothetical protein MUK42_15172 [Musa troglodytarum]URD79365.1 hypothetical protein MUK42_15172 [Musa troglodytarum]URD79366.1 hypothetical protein MUK42_15172 [Musa troglodytarum]
MGTSSDDDDLPIAFRRTSKRQREEKSATSSQNVIDVSSSLGSQPFNAPSVSRDFVQMEEAHDCGATEREEGCLLEVASSSTSSGVDLRVMKRRCLPTPAFRLSEGMSAGKRPTWARGSPHGPSVEVSRGPLNPLVKIPPPASSVRDPDPAGVWDRDPSAAGGLDPTVGLS